MENEPSLELKEVSPKEEVRRGDLVDQPLIEDDRPPVQLAGTSALHLEVMSSNDRSSPGWSAAAESVPEDLEDVHNAIEADLSPEWSAAGDIFPPNLEDSQNNPEFEQHRQVRFDNPTLVEEELDRLNIQVAGDPPRACWGCELLREELTHVNEKLAKVEADLQMLREQILGSRANLPISEEMTEVKDKVTEVESNLQMLREQILGSRANLPISEEMNEVNVKVAKVEEDLQMPREQILGSRADLPMSEEMTEVNVKVAKVEEDLQMLRELILESTAYLPISHSLDNLEGGLVALGLHTQALNGGMQEEDAPLCCPKGCSIS